MTLSQLILAAVSLVPFALIIHYLSTSFMEESCINEAKGGNLNEVGGTNEVGDTGHHFTEDGEFLDQNGNKFEFAVSSKQSENQARYENIGIQIDDYLYNLMETEYGLERVSLLPKGKTDSIPSFVFVSKDFQTSDKKKLILINGSGAVRAGQWARSVIMNHNLYKGSMLPYIKWGNDSGYDILVMNTNECGPEMEGSRMPIEHAKTAWTQFLEDNISEDSVDIVAHSYGGIIVESLLSMSNFKTVVRKIALTDALQRVRYPSDVSCINWVSSRKSVNESLDNHLGCDIRSAGCTSHPMTSHSAKDSVFVWFSME